jgi:hypothetical protein
MAFLEGDVKIPVVGKVPKKAAAGGVAVVGVLVVVYYVRKSKSASGAAATAAAGAAATSTDQYPPDGTTGNPDDPYSTDPATGQTYGDEESGSGGSYGAYGGDSANSGTYPWDGTTGNSSDPYSLDPTTGETYGNEGTGTSAPTGENGPPFPNNSAWENWAVQQLLTNDPSISQSDLTTALGLYLNGQPVSAAQKTLIFDATGTADDPPIAGPSNYPPNVRTNGDTGGKAATVQVPNVVGKTAAEATSQLEEVNLKASNPKGTPGGSVVTATSPSAGSTVAAKSTVTITSKAAAVKVPDVTGRTAAEATTVIEAAGLRAANPKGTPGSAVVISTSPKAGTQVAGGSTVSVTSKAAAKKK